jgi:hypothetical protein
MEIAFQHRQSAHCESGVAANLLSHHGVGLSEALAFGIGAGLFFAYLPFIRLNQLPLTTYRIATGGILRRVTRRLGVGLRMRCYRRPARAMAALDARLDQGLPVGCQTGGYWLPYFPPAYRFHFNMHNLVVYGREGDNYLVSDPIFEAPVRCARADLERARFSRGALAPRGRMYVVESTPHAPDLRKAVVDGIREVCRIMTRTPVCLIGVRGIRLLASRLEGWPARLGAERTRLHLGQLIRMQEEIGTGGGGFRFMYAAFLQEAAGVLEAPALLTFAERMTAVGDKWRQFAASGARNCKGRATAADDFPSMAARLRHCADLEEGLFRELETTVMADSRALRARGQGAGCRGQAPGAPGDR